MKTLKLVLSVLIAGGLGGITNSILVWSLGVLGVTPALGFGMVPELTIEWLLRRVFASALWGVIFLIPLCENSPIKKGLILGILPWVSSILFVFPVRMNAGFFGLAFGLATPLWTLFFAAVWGVTGTLFLSRITPKP